MKNIKLETLPSGSYRIRKMINGKSIQIVFDHKPSQAEIIKALSKQAVKTPVKGSFADCGNKYIEMKSHVLSPTTVTGYKSIMRRLPDTFKNRKISAITQIDVQKLINEYASKNSPKTVCNIHGFIASVFGQFCPDVVLHTALPQKVQYEGYLPTQNDVKRILDASKGSAYHIPFQLALMSLRRSEICALTLDDIDEKNNLLTVNKAMVRDANDQSVWIIKTTKTNAGTREIYIPDFLINEIKENGKVFDGNPDTILKNLHRYQDSLGIPRFRLHDARHYFASYAHAHGMPDANIMKAGGWKSDHVMKSVYRHEMNQKQAEKGVIDNMFS